MATDKRDRQRANRAQKQAHEAKHLRRVQAFALIKRYGLYLLLIVAAVLLLSLLR